MSEVVDKNKDKKNGKTDMSKGSKVIIKITSSYVNMEYTVYALGIRVVIRTLNRMLHSLRQYFSTINSLNTKK